MFAEEFGLPARTMPVVLHWSWEEGGRGWGMNSAPHLEHVHDASEGNVGPVDALLLAGNGGSCVDGHGKRFFGSFWVLMGLQ